MPLETNNPTNVTHCANASAFTRNKGNHLGTRHPNFTGFAILGYDYHAPGAFWVSPEGKLHNLSVPVAGGGKSEVCVEDPEPGCLELQVGFYYRGSRAEMEETLPCVLRDGGRGEWVRIWTVKQEWTVVGAEGEGIVDVRDEWTEEGAEEWEWGEEVEDVDVETVDMGEGEGRKRKWEEVKEEEEHATEGLRRGGSSR